MNPNFLSNDVYQWSQDKKFADARFLPLLEEVRSAHEFVGVRSEQLWRAVNKLERVLAGPLSIDSCLATHPGDLELTAVAKGLIVFLLSTAETEASAELSGLLNPSREQFWATGIGEVLRTQFESINANSSAGPFAQNFEIVTFNYDRLFEEACRLAVPMYFDQQFDHLKDDQLLSSLKIHHVFGKIGKLTDQADDKNGKWPFGQDTARLFAPADSQPNSSSINTLAGGIRTFDEGGQHVNAIRQIHDSISSADQIVFMGISFNRQGLERILPKRPLQKVRKIHCMAKGLSQQDIAAIEEFLKNSMNHSFVTVHSKGSHNEENWTAGQFIRDLRFTLLT